jgi:hypothetical protein
MLLLLLVSKWGRRPFVKPATLAFIVLFPSLHGMASMMAAAAVVRFWSRIQANILVLPEPKLVQLLFSSIGRIIKILRGASFLEPYHSFTLFHAWRRTIITLWRDHHILGRRAASETTTGSRVVIESGAGATTDGGMGGRVGALTTDGICATTDCGGVRILMTRRGVGSLTMDTVALGNGGGGAP